MVLEWLGKGKMCEVVPRNYTSGDQEIFTSDPDVFEDKIVTSSKQLNTQRPAVIQQVSPKRSRSERRRVVLPGRFKDFVM